MAWDVDCSAKIEVLAPPWVSAKKYQAEVPVVVQVVEERASALDGSAGCVPMFEFGACHSVAASLFPTTLIASRSHFSLSLLSNADSTLSVAFPHLLYIDSILDSASLVSIISASIIRRSLSASVLSSSQVSAVNFNMPESRAWLLRASHIASAPKITPSTTRGQPAPCQLGHRVGDGGLCNNPPKYRKAYPKSQLLKAISFCSVISEIPF